MPFHYRTSFFIFFSILTLIFAGMSTFSFNDLLIDDTPHSNMNVSNNSTRPNESSAEDELDEEGQTDEDDKQKFENGASNSNLNNRNIFRTLLKQIHLLHETNSKLFRSLHETKGKWVISDSIIFYIP